MNPHDFFNSFLYTNWQTTAPSICNDLYVLIRLRWGVSWQVSKLSEDCLLGYARTINLCCNGGFFKKQTYLNVHAVMDARFKTVLFYCLTAITMYSYIFTISTTMVWVVLHAQSKCRMLKVFFLVYGQRCQIKSYVFVLVKRDIVCGHATFVLASSMVQALCRSSNSG
jgi:hypothetical protein